MATIKLFLLLRSHTRPRAAMTHGCFRNYSAAAAIGTYTAHIKEDMIKYPSSYFSPKKISKGLCNH